MPSPDGKNCEDEACPARLCTSSSPRHTRRSSKKKRDTYHERMVQMFGEPQQYRAYNMYGPDSRFADPNFKPKTLKCMNPNLRLLTKQEVDEYFAWYESTAWNPLDEDVEMEDDLANPAISNVSEKSFSDEANTQGGETMELDQDLSAEIEAEGHMKYMFEGTSAEPQGDEEMTDAPEVPIPDWYDESIAPFRIMKRTRPAPFPIPKPHHSVEEVPHQQDMNNVAAPVVAVPSHSDQSRSPAEHLADVDMLERLWFEVGVCEP